MPSHGDRDGGKRRMFAFPRVKSAEWLQWHYDEWLQDLSLGRRAGNNQALPVQDSDLQTLWMTVHELTSNKTLIPVDVIMFKIMALDCLTLSQISKS